MEPKSIFGSRQDNPYSSQSSRKLINSSIKTPALLFYKPSQNTTKKPNPNPDQICPQQNNFPGRHEPTERCCENHTNIAAKYFSKTDDQEEEIYYCEKCAQLLEDQGFQIIPIGCLGQGQRKDQQRALNQCSNGKTRKSSGSHSYPYPQRQHQIKDFLANLAQYREQLTQNSSQVRQILINSQQFYGQQIEQINEYFQSIIQSLQLQKNKCYNHILQQRQNAQKETRNLIHKLTQSQKQINSMIADIEENLDSVYSISWQNYQLVMDTFGARLAEVCGVLREIREKGIADVEYRRIQFAGVPESINSLSEIIIQNSFGSVNYADGSLLLTEGSMDSMKRGQELQEINPNVPDSSIFQKLRTDHSLDSQKTPTSMMFSFDAQHMRELTQPQPLQQNNPNHNKITPSQTSHENQIKLRKNRNFNQFTPTYNLDHNHNHNHSHNHNHNNNNNQKLSKVAGVKEVQEIDVLVMDEDQLWNNGDGCY